MLPPPITAIGPAEMPAWAWFAFDARSVFEVAIRAP